jgi:cytochrome c-type biogenesis protein CcmH/NrfG
MPPRRAPSQQSSSSPSFEDLADVRERMARTETNVEACRDDIREIRSDIKEGFQELGETLKPLSERVLTLEEAHKADRRVRKWTLGIAAAVVATFLGSVARAFLGL